MENKKTVIVGIDGGQYGALAFIDLTGNLLKVIDMPFIPSVGVDSKRLRDILLSWKNKFNIHAVFELCNANPKLGVKASFSFGRNLQVPETVLICLDIPITYIRPQEWEKEFSLINKNKQDSCKIACQMQPLFSGEFMYKGNRGYVFKDGRADAYLIAEYGRRKIKL